jgi:hypothetical protein
LENKSILELNVIFLVKLVLKRIVPKAPNCVIDLLPESTPYAPIFDNVGFMTTTHLDEIGERNMERFLIGLKSKPGLIKIYAGEKEVEANTGLAGSV